MTFWLVFFASTAGVLAAQVILAAGLWVMKKVVVWWLVRKMRKLGAVHFPWPQDANDRAGEFPAQK